MRASEQYRHSVWRFWSRRAFARLTRKRPQRPRAITGAAFFRSGVWGLETGSPWSALPGDDRSYLSTVERPLGAKVEPISLKLGEGVGIRDLPALQSGGLLISSGPTIEQEAIPYRIWHLPPPLDPNGAGLTELAIIKSNAVAKKGLPKAESITVLQEQPVTKKITVLVNHDNIDEGAPARHELTLTP